ncbi:MAG: tRNA lysidine(34) synthetase TilS [Gemmatimonadota bacterium]|nr:tRNA lysidine(34) synthetase TilS [Gemmatimonadota bacterium]MDQ8171582.1 tRNA lysidine(34) synthetase TilS [Gemmatimonadota bacterium]
MSLTEMSLTHDVLPETPPTGPGADLLGSGTILQATLDVALAPVVGGLVLAVSGGRDSMALLFAMARWAPDRIAAVATFDHGTGDHATSAASMVAAEGRRLGLTVVRERARTPAHGEAAWRAARWAFLERVGRAFRARVATAHTRDDQLETVVMRLLRGAGARGLAALAAPSPVVRPWLAVSRDELARWARLERVPYLDDPMNASPAFLRTRVRHDLLPALEVATPGFGAGMLAVADRAAAWRREVEALIDAAGATVSSRGDRASMALAAVAGTSPEGRGVLWPAFCARAGVTLDARGTRELVRFTTQSRRGAHVMVSGGALVLHRAAHPDEPPGDRVEVRRRDTAVGRAATTAWQGTAEGMPPRFGRFRFRRWSPAAAEALPDGAEPWVMGIPRDGVLTLRCWVAGDRIRTAGAPAGRRVTRYFAAAHVPALDRSGWPVVLVNDEVVWVPGVCRGLAAPSRPGWPEVIWYRCEPERD